MDAQDPTPWPNGLRPGPQPASWRWLWAHPSHFLAAGMGAGLSPWAPGTVGTLWAWWVWEWGLKSHQSLGLAWLWVAAVVLGVVVSTHAARSLNNPDPSAVVWDEAVAMWMVLAVGAPRTGWEALALFALFRFFDAVKPGPVGWADRLYKRDGGEPITYWQGWGIVWDDLVAGACTLLVWALWRAWGA